MECLCKKLQSYKVNKKTGLYIVLVAFMDVNLGTGTRLDGVRYEDDFLLMGGTRTRPESRRVRGGYFFPPDGYPILFYRYDFRL
jgi:hypothetical protein